jgi:hypothetical protein
MTKGIQFVIDDTGKKTAVIFNLKECGELWEDIYDVLVSESRRDEPTISWKELKAEIVEKENITKWHIKSNLPTQQQRSYNLLRTRLSTVLLWR